jgi:hypothetical protein
MLPTVSDKRRAAAFAGFAVLLLLAGCVAGLVFPQWSVFSVGAGFVGYVLYGRKAMLLSRADDAVFTPRRTWSPASAAGSAAAAGLMAGTIGSYLLGHGTRPVDQWPGGRPGRARQEERSNAGQWPDDRTGRTP